MSDQTGIAADTDRFLPVSVCRKFLSPARLKNRACFAMMGTDIFRKEGIIVSETDQELAKRTGIKVQVIEEIRELARRHQIKKVLLFGSRARGDYDRASDIDLAVQGGNVVEFALDVEEETSTLLFFDVVDLSSSLSENFRAEIEKDGVTIYEEI